MLNYLSAELSLHQLFTLMSRSETRADKSLHVPERRPFHRLIGLTSWQSGRLLAEQTDFGASLSEPEYDRRPICHVLTVCVWVNIRSLNHMEAGRRAE